MIQDKADWLENLKAGDEVFISQPYGSLPIINRAARTTKTQIVIRVNDRYEQMYRKKDGALIGCGLWDVTVLMMPDENTRHEIMIASLRGKITNAVKNHELPNDIVKLTQIIELMKKEPASEV